MISILIATALVVLVVSIAGGLLLLALQFLLAFILFLGRRVYRHFRKG